MSRCGNWGVKALYRDTDGAEVRTSMVDVFNEAGYLLELLQRIA